MRRGNLQGFFDYMTASAEAYPYNFQFRTALPNQVFLLADQIAELRPVALLMMQQAFDIDPSSSELASKLLALQRVLGQCDAAKATAEKMLRLAHGTPRAVQIAALPCIGAADAR